MTKQNQKDELGFHTFKKEAHYSNFPENFSSYVRSFGDIYFWKKGNFHVITKAHLAKKALKNPAISCDRAPFFISRMPNMDLNLLPDFFGVVSKMMVMRDGKEHMLRRSIGNYGLNEDLINPYSAKITPVIAKFINEDIHANSIDFVETISQKLPSLILADLFCIPQSDRKDFYRWSNCMTTFFGGGTSYENKDGILVNQAAHSLKSYFKELLAKRKLEKTEDFFSGMLKVSDQHDLDDDDLISQAIMMLVAGQVTTTDQMNNVLFLLLNNTEILQDVQENPELIPAMIEELKRLDPAVTFIFRVANEDTQIGDQMITKGDTIFISTHCINRDPDVFENPNQINIRRKNLNHFSYGYGSHYCLGAKLGRL
ncbi:cytochrome P450, partial [bacterium]|nr:cytochrome P450 [bacterium]